MTLIVASVVVRFCAQHGCMISLLTLKRSCSRVELVVPRNGIRLESQRRICKMRSIVDGSHASTDASRLNSLVVIQTRDSDTSVCLLSA